MNSLIETFNLGKKFGKTWAVRNLNLAVPEGSVFALLGPNGAGKSTTIQMIMNLLSPDAGQAQVFGVPSQKLGPSEYQQIGYISENQELPMPLTVKEFLSFCQGLYVQWDPGFADRLMTDFELPPKSRIKNLSRGMKMKLSLLSSLAYRPKLIVLDEPFTGLDPLVRDDFIKGLLELSEQEGWTLFISSHDIDEVERLADWIGILDRGELRLVERTESLQSRFRRVVVTVENGETILPHSSWLQFERSGRHCQFVVPDYQKTSMPETSGISFEARPMTLREIYISLARAQKTPSIEKELQ